MYPSKWAYLNIHNIELGDVIEVSAYEGTYYLVCGPRLSGSLAIYDGETNVSQQALSVKLSSNGDSSLDLSGRTSIAGERYEPGDAEVTWSSSNTDVATVSSSGVVMPKKAGTVTITASWPDSYFRCSNTVTVNVQVNQPPLITDVQLDPAAGVSVVTATDDHDADVLKYGYSDSKDAVPDVWQDSNEFTGLLGQKWFWAKDTEDAVSKPYEKFVYGNADIVDSELVGLKTEYFVGDKIDVDGAALVLKFSNGDTLEIPVTEDMLSDYDNTVPGPEDITVTYGDIVKLATVNFHKLDFSVEFPDEIAIRIDENGNPVVDGDYVIKNNSSFAVKVTGIRVTGKDGWSIFDSGELDDRQTLDIVLDGVKGCVDRPNGEETVAALDELYPNGEQEFEFFNMLKEKIRDNIAITGSQSLKMRNAAHVAAWQGKLNDVFGYTDDGSPKLTASNVGTDSVSLRILPGRKGMSLQIFNDELASMVDNTKELLLTINGCSTGSAGLIDTDNAVWTIDAGEALPLRVNVQFPAQTELEPGTVYTIASIDWTADWAYDSGSETPSPDEPVDPPEEEYLPFVVTKSNRSEIGFEGTTNETLSIPETFTDADGKKYRVTEIGNGAFEASGLMSVTIPSSVAKIGNRVFANCSNLTSVSFMVDAETQRCDLTSIGEDAFCNCKKLSADGYHPFKIPSCVEIIGEYAFRNIGWIYYDGPASGGKTWGALSNMAM